ncbi:MAG: hypothetical protein ACP5P1_01550 [Acidimicrobiales bacterium]
MTQPAHVPVLPTDRVRSSRILPAPRPWKLGRPGETGDREAPSGPRLGSAGPDLGFGLKLASRLADRVVLADGEDLHDVVAGCFACASRRASHYGRAPVVFDVEWSYGLWGYLDQAPTDLVDWRRPLFRGASHDYWDQRRIADAVKVEALGMTPHDVRKDLASWKERLIV